MGQMHPQCKLTEVCGVTPGCICCSRLEIIVGLMPLLSCRAVRSLRCQDALLNGGNPAWSRRLQMLTGRISSATEPVHSSPAVVLAQYLL